MAFLDFLRTSKTPVLSGVRLPKRSIVVVILLISTVLGFICHSHLGETVEGYSIRRVEFFLRNWLGRYPVLDPRIKIFIFDDPMTSTLGQTELDLKEWAQILEALDKHKPARIFIDKIFGFPGNDPAVARDFRDRLKALQTQIVVASFYAQNAIKAREPITANEEGQPVPLYDLDLTPLSKDHPLWTSKIWPYYGPDKSLKPGFDRVGHIAYEKNGYVFPFTRFSEDRAVPHISFWAADKLEVKNDNIYVDEVPVKVDSRARIFVNMASLNYYFSKTFGMLELYKRAYSGKPISVVKEGDVVILLPLMYTGNTDWVSTPVEDMPGGFVYTAMVNSALTKEYVRVVENHFGYVLLFCLLGAVAALFLSPLVLGLVSLGVVTGLVGAGLLSFVFYTTCLPWGFSVLSFVFSTLAVYTLKAQSEKIEAVRVASELATASLVQEMYYPPAEIRTPRVHIGGYRESASECSGDWWFHLTAHDRWEYLIIADAMGHGTPAALLTAMAYSSFHNLVSEVQNKQENAHSQDGSDLIPPDVFLGKFNALVYGALKGKMLMSAWVGCFDSHTGVFTYSSAGHQPAVLMPALVPGSEKQKKIKALPGGGSPVGFEKDFVYTTTEIRLEPGDRIFAYTDGLLESHNPAKPDWKLKSVLKYLEDQRSLEIIQLSEAIFKEAQGYHGEMMKADDVTYFMAEFSLTSVNAATTITPISPAAPQESA